MGSALASGTSAKLTSLPTVYDAFYYFILPVYEGAAVSFNCTRIEQYKTGTRYRGAGDILQIDANQTTRSIGKVNHRGNEIAFETQTYSRCSVTGVQFADGNNSRGRGRIASIILEPRLAKVPRPAFPCPSGTRFVSSNKLHCADCGNGAERTPGV